MKPNNILYITTLFFVISAFNSPAENTKNQINSDSKTEYLKAEIKLLEQEKINLEDNKLAIENITDVIVIVNKTYFHSQPNSSTRLKSYLVYGDIGTLTKMRNGYGYIQFYNSNNGKSTNGWIRLTDIEEYTDY